MKLMLLFRRPSGEGLSSLNAPFLGPDMANAASLITTNLLSVSVYISQANKGLLVNFNCSSFPWILFLILPHTRFFMVQAGHSCLCSSHCCQYFMLALQVYTMGDLVQALNTQHLNVASPATMVLDGCSP